MRKLLLTLAVAAIPGVVQAGDVAITGFAGYTFPFHSQTFTYGPGPVSVGIPGVSLEQSGSFNMGASGSLALGGAIAFYPTEGVGFEFRLDSAGLDLTSNESTFGVTATLPSPLPPVEETLALDDGVATVDSLKPLSLNLKLRTTGDTKLYVSGGVSRIGGFHLRLQQTVALGVTKVDTVTGNLEVTTTDLRAVRDGETAPHAWGGNLGLGLEIPLGEHAGLVLEGRGFYFPKLQVDWEPTTAYPAGSVEAQLLDRVLDSIQPVEFEPWWVQATAGIAIRF